MGNSETNHRFFTCYGCCTNTPRSFATTYIFVATVTLLPKQQNA